MATLIGVAAALAAGSVALLGFGIDSFIESASGAVLIWRLGAERRTADAASVERMERRAQRLVAVSLIVLAVYISLDALLRLGSGERPGVSRVGIALTATSLGVMWWLARAKRRTAAALGSRAMEADAFQSTACWWLSLIRPRRCQPERGVRLVVGRSSGGARDDVLPGARGA